MKISMNKPDRKRLWKFEYGQMWSTDNGLVLRHEKNIDWNRNEHFLAGQKH